MEKTVLNLRLDQGYAITVGLRLDGNYIIRMIIDFPNTAGGFQREGFKDSREAEYICHSSIDSPVSALREALRVLKPT